MNDQRDKNLSNTNKNTKKASNMRVGNTIIWASLVLAISLLISGHDNDHLVIILMVIGWYASTTASDFKQLRQAECAFFKRLGSRTID